jgi:hypothetical protein
VWRPSLAPVYHTGSGPHSTENPGNWIVQHRWEERRSGALLSRLTHPLVKAGLAISLAVAGIITLDAVLDDDWGQKTVKPKAAYNAKR